MRLTEILEPSLIALRHYEVKGLQIGAGMDAAIRAPPLSLNPSLFNLQDYAPLVAIAKCTGTCAVIGTVPAGCGCNVKLATVEKEGVITRADALRRKVEQRKLDYVSPADSCEGLDLVSLRFSKVAETEIARFLMWPRRKPANGSSSASRRSSPSFIQS